MIWWLWVLIISLVIGFIISLIVYADSDNLFSFLLIFLWLPLAIFGFFCWLVVLAFEC